MATISEAKSQSRPSSLYVPKPDDRTGSQPPRLALFLLIFGLFLTLRGYHSFDGDQAYRLPLLLHKQDPTLYANDPFVRAFDHFNPHRGYLALLDVASRPFGVASALLGLFVLTFVATSVGVDRLARAIWPESGGRVGLVALVLVLLAKAGNIGTNHLFESTLLDRLIGFALGWLALASAVENPRRGVGVGAITLGVASLIHPSVGLQLALTLAVAWVVWGILRRFSGVGRRQAALAIGALGLALAPGLILMAGQGGKLFDGLSIEEFRLLAVQIQGPQHMLPSTWRLSQWLAWGCYPVLAILALAQSSRPWPKPRIRFVLLLGVNLASLALAYLAVQVVGDLRVTVFQPFRMATLARGLALVAVSGRVVGLWSLGDLFSRGRAVLIGVGLGGDWMMVVATLVDLTLASFEKANIPAQVTRWLGLATLGFGLYFLARHDTESGHWSLLAGLGILVAGTGCWAVASRRIESVSAGQALPYSWLWLRRVARIWPALALGACWALPLASFGIGLATSDPGRSAWLLERCRFAEVPTDDLERLALWARENTPEDCRFIGPPGPKTFRLWSRRSVAFNRAGSPYHAAGLADWASRFREHVGFEGTTAEFARAYLANRHGLEAAYGRMTDAELVKLARSQGADHVLTASNRVPEGPDSRLVKLRVEGRYAIYRVVDDATKTR